VGKKRIQCSLTEKGIDNAIKELEQYKKELERKAILLRERIAEKIALEARQGFVGAMVDDVLKGGSRSAQVDVTLDNRENISVVVANGEDAVWVEFGAGVYYNGAPGSSPHPKGSELGFTIGGFGKGRGKRDTWGFYRDGELQLTHGTPSVMPMYNAVKTACDSIADIAKEVFG